jgi:hypothetical protein
MILHTQRGDGPLRIAEASPIVMAGHLAQSGWMRNAVPMLSRDSSSDACPLDEAILSVLRHTGGKTLSAPEIAHAIAPDGDWHDLLVPIRRTAVSLAQCGRLVIYRKGKIVDPTDFRGVYRLGLPRQD